MSKTKQTDESNEVIGAKDVEAYRLMLGVLVARQLLGFDLSGEDGLSFREVVEQLSNACEDASNESLVWEAVAHGAACVSEICSYRSAICKLRYRHQLFDDLWRQICRASDAYFSVHTAELAVLKEGVGDALATLNARVCKLENCFECWSVKRAERFIREAVDAHECLINVMDQYVDACPSKMQNATVEAVDSPLKTPAPEAEKAEPKPEVAAAECDTVNDGGPTASSVNLDKVDKGGNEDGEE